MKNKFIIFVCFLTFLSCGKSSDSNLASISPEKEALNQLRKNTTYWQQIAPICQGHPSKEDCDDGDMTLFNGLLCASGDVRACESVRKSQSVDGRFWRSPRRNPGNIGFDNSFSRDMSLGVLLYLATTKDKDAAKRWMEWINSNRPCLVENPLGSNCIVQGAHRLCRDDEDYRCTITPGLWATMGRVYRYIDVPRHTEMKRYENYDDDLATIEAVVTEPGYELHLKGVSILLREIMGQSSGWRKENATLLVKKQPLNPFFQYLKDGATVSTINRTGAICPRPETHSDAIRFQWAWERADASEAWLESMGWDCLFMYNLFAKKVV